MKPGHVPAENADNVNELGDIGMRRSRIRDSLDRVRGDLLAERTSQGHWTGRLSDSALSTATAVSAIAALRIHGDRGEALLAPLQRGLQYLRNTQNADGGFGDTDRSHSNIATSYLVIAAMKLADEAGLGDATWTLAQQNQCERYIEQAGGLVGLRQRYGKDKTFVVPIMTNLAIAGALDWSEVPSLPFEAAVVPQSWYRFVGMPVVSYAVPALVAMGQVKFLIGGGCARPYRWLRRAAISRSMDVLQRMQPASGGYLEATPLTAFVVMSLAASDRVNHAVTRNGVAFLLDSQTESGGWPIDTNLATWVTSLATLALDLAPEDDGVWSSDELVEWQLSCQHRLRHPFTGAEPGGWGWTDLSGAVPDADDTPGAIVSLLAQRSRHSNSAAQIDTACEAGVGWLLKLQNRDGGWPTFCRGWGKLPFDRSSVDLTSHAIRAINAWRRHGGMANRSHRRAMDAGHRFLRRNQQSDGSWVPLWFGNQDRAEEDNPVYGTGRVLVDADESLGVQPITRGLQYLIDHQNADGGWGGGPSVTSSWAASSLNEAGSVTSTVEETAIAVEALADWGSRFESSRLNWPDGLRASAMAATLSGADWLVDAIDQDRHHQAWPIGFYFAKLWYHEKLYPPIFAAAALARVSRLLATSR